MCVVKYVNKFGDTGILFPPQMHCGDYGNNVGMLKPITVPDEQFEEIPWGNAVVEGVRVSETPDPSVFENPEDEIPASHFAESDERLGGEPGGPFSLHIFRSPSVASSLILGPYNLKAPIMGLKLTVVPSKRL